tara:strand:- start:643 stop:1389 length:747 start_codon:yes stop_codon:yes gene_type:complete
MEINKIHQGDCMELMQHIPDKVVNMILCDLPYGTTACEWDKVLPLEELWKHYKRILKDDGVVVLTASQPFTTDLINSNKKWFRYCWVWYKSKPSGIAFKNQPMRSHEDIVVFAKGKTNFNKIMEERIGFTESSKKRLKSSTTIKYRNYKSEHNQLNETEFKNVAKLRNPTTILKFASVPNRLGTLHPTQKPVALFEYLIKTYTNEGELVLDNCIGSGTTAVACKQTNRRFIGIEINQEYVDIANKRLS